MSRRRNARGLSRELKMQGAAARGGHGFENFCTSAKGQEAFGWGRRVLHTHADRSSSSASKACSSYRGHGPPRTDQRAVTSSTRATTRFTEVRRGLGEDFLRRRDVITTAGKAATTPPARARRAPHPAPNPRISSSLTGRARPGRAQRSDPRRRRAPREVCRSHPRRCGVRARGSWPPV